MGLIIFSDLDGTLLDHHDYSWDAARPALAALKGRGVPLILCSSKTRTEMVGIWFALTLDQPFISENGGGIFLPRDHPLACEEGIKPAGTGWRVLPLGLPITELRQRLRPINQDFGARGFAELSDHEVAEMTGLSPAEASRARQREFNEPVVLPEDADPEAWAREVRGAGLQVTRGGRFWHVLGGGDKGKAVALLTELFSRRDPALRSAGLGDAPNDLTMLAQVNTPILVARPDGGHAELDLPGLIRRPEPGPAGWNAAVLELLERQP